MFQSELTNIKYHSDILEPEIIQAFYNFYNLVPLVEDKKGLKYPEIAIGKNTNLQILFPLKLCSNFEGLTTFETGYNSYFKFNWLSKDFYYKGDLMSLTFSKIGIIFNCFKMRKGQLTHVELFKYIFPHIQDLNTYISNQGKF